MTNPFAPVPVIEYRIPQLTRAECSALLDEALQLAEALEKKIDEMSTWLEQNVKPVV